MSSWWFRMKHPLFAALILAAGLAWPIASTPALSKEEDLFTHIAKAPIAGVPPGAYSQWTDEEKKTAITRIGSFCEFLCIDSYGTATFPNVAAAERAKAEAKVCLAACIVNHLPSDYPQRAAMKDDLRADYDKARKAGSPIPWPLPGQ